MPRLCENYLRKIKVGNTLHVLAENDIKVGNRTQNTTLYQAYVGINLARVLNFGVFTQPVPKDEAARRSLRVR